ncbi:MAG: cadherin-like domain-containing protein [Nitrospirae bacterium]|nr:cadherin-like domain-containing protein [Nitrospirota bacterium]
MRKLKTMIVVILFLMSSFVVFPPYSWSEIIFEDNFDNDPDWFPQTEVAACLNSACKNQVPGLWDYYNSDELWHPHTDGLMFHPSMQISSDNFRGQHGKAFTMWNESNDGRSGDGWGAIGGFSKDLGRDYNEIYVRVYVKFQPGFQWFYTQDNNAMIKMVHVRHWDRVGSPFTAFNTGYSAPLYVFDSVQNPYGFRHSHSHRCDPQENNYYCSINYDSSFNYTGNPTYTNSLGDGMWHALEFHVKMNSAPGVADGVIEFWADDNLQYSRADIRWMGNDSPGGLGWNVVGLGYNAYNSFAPASEKKEQWYAIDDVVISTSRIGGGSQPLSISTSSLPSATLDTPYSQTISTSGGTAPTGLSIISGTLPGGLSLTSSAISGTPTTTGTYNFTIKAQDSSSPAETATKALSITVNSQPVNNPPVANNQTVSTSANTPLPITLTASDLNGDDLNYSVVINPTHGSLSGTAPNLTYTPDNNYIGSDSLTFKANDSKADSNTATISVTINAATSTEDGGLVAFYTFSGNAKDDSGYNNNGIVSGATLTSGKIGQAYRFNASNQAISVNEATNLDGFDKLTVSLWFNTTDYGISTNYPLLISKSNTSAYAIGFAASENRIWSYVNGSPVTSTTGFMSDKLGGWHHVVLTYDGIEQVLYFDGVRIASRAQSGSLNDYASPVIIGNQQNMTSQFSGSIDHVAIYSRAMSESELKQPPDRTTIISSVANP